MISGIHADAYLVPTIRTSEPPSARNLCVPKRDSKMALQIAINSTIFASSSPTIVVVFLQEDRGER